MSGQRRRARRRRELSQHFLRSRSLAARLVDQSTISARDLVVEIGPGRGILTHELAKRSGRLVAVELDRCLVTGLRETYADNDHVDVVLGDFLKYSLPTCAYKVFGNIPYSATAAIIRRLVDAPVPPVDAYCIVQRESADRFAGHPFAPETSASLLMKPWWQIEICHRLRRSDFDPPPSVESVMLWLARRTRPLIQESHGQIYRKFISGSFGRRGNTVRQCLKSVFTGPQVARLARDLRFNPNARPSELTFDQWLGLFRFLTLK